MALCDNCGTEFPNNMNYCPQCGESQTYNNQGNYTPADDYRQIREQADPARAFVYSTPKDRLPLGTGGFLSSLLIMSIPIIGLIFQIIWAVGGARNVNRRNLARAYLLFTVIMLLISVLAIAGLINYIDGLLAGTGFSVFDILM